MSYEQLKLRIDRLEGLNSYNKVSVDSLVVEIAALRVRVVALEGTTPLEARLKALEVEAEERAADYTDDPFSGGFIY